MPSAAEQFAEIHYLRLAYREVREQLERGPRQIKARQNRVRQAEEEIEALRGQLKELRGAGDRKSLDLKVNESKIADLRTKLNVATNNREYDIIRGQIEADTSANSVLEDEILEALEKVDRTQSEIKEQEGRIEELRQQTQQFAGEFEQKSVELNAKVGKLGSQIEQAESGLTGDLAVQYKRLLDALKFRSKRRLALVNVIDGKVNLTHNVDAVILGGKKDVATHRLGFHFCFIHFWLLSFTVKSYAYAFG